MAVALSPPGGHLPRTTRQECSLGVGLETAGPTVSVRPLRGQCPWHLGPVQANSAWAPSQPHPVLHSGSSSPGPLCPSHRPGTPARVRAISLLSPVQQGSCVFHNQISGRPCIPQAPVNVRSPRGPSRVPRHGMTPPPRGAAPRFPSGHRAHSLLRWLPEVFSSALPLGGLRPGPPGVGANFSEVASSLCSVLRSLLFLGSCVALM